MLLVTLQPPFGVLRSPTRTSAQARVPQGEFLYELIVWVSFCVAILKLFIDQLFDPPYDLWLYCGGWVVAVVVGRFSHSKSESISEVRST